MDCCFGTIGFCVLFAPLDNFGRIYFSASACWVYLLFLLPFVIDVGLTLLATPGYFVVCGVDGVGLLGCSYLFSWCTSILLTIFGFYILFSCLCVFI